MNYLYIQRQLSKSEYETLMDCMKELSCYDVAPRVVTNDCLVYIHKTFRQITLYQQLTYCKWHNDNKFLMINNY